MGFRKVVSTHCQDPNGNHWLWFVVRGAILVVRNLRPSRPDSMLPSTLIRLHFIENNQ